MKKIITFVLMLSMLFCGTFSSVYVRAEENSGSETEYLDYEPAYTPVDRIGQNIGNRSIISEGDDQDDDRSIVDDVTVSPYCKIVLVRSFFYYQGEYVEAVRSTGFILGPDLIVVSGHALHREFTINNETKYLTAGLCYVFLETNGEAPTDDDVIRSVAIFVPNEYKDRTNNNRACYDWGYIIVEEPVGYTQGWFGFGTIAQPHTVDVAGYPDTQPRGSQSSQRAENYKMYVGSGQVEPHPTKNLLVKHTVDTTAGQSGAPIYDSNQIVWGIHVLGSSGNNWNSGIKINSDIFALLREKKQEGIDRWG